MKSLTQDIRYYQAILSYADKHGVTKAAIKYRTYRQFIYRLRNRYDAMILSRTVDKFLTRKRMLKKSRQWSHRTVDVSSSEEAHRLMNKFDGCSNSS